MLNQSGSAKAETMVKFVLIFFISLLSFSVGTFVGKQFSDSQYKMAQLEGDNSGERDPSSLDPAALESSPPNALTEEDIASLEEEFAKGKTVDTEKPNTKTSEEKHEGKHEAAAEHAETHKEVVKKVGHAVEKAIEKVDAINHEAKHVKASSMKKAEEKIAEIAEKVLKGEPPTTHKAEGERTPSSLPKTVANDVIGKFTVQVAAYSKEPDAVEHTKALKDKGFSAFYIPGSVKGQTWFRVNVGLYSTSKEAQDYLKKIVGQDIKSAIIKKIVQN